MELINHAAKHFTKRTLIQHSQRRCCFFQIPSIQKQHPTKPKQNKKFTSSRVILLAYLRVRKPKDGFSFLVSSNAGFAARSYKKHFVFSYLCSCRHYFSGSLDLIRTSRMAIYGLIIQGPSQHIWFNFMAKCLPKRDVVTTLKKLVIGQLVFGPYVTSVFFSFNAALQGENASEIAARLKRDVLPTQLNGLIFWPLCDFFTYKVIPVHLQPLMNSTFSYIWTIYLTYMASLQKALAD